MAQNDDKILVDVRETNPVITTDGGGAAYLRGTKRGELMAQIADLNLFGIEGSFGVLSTTSGTAVTGQASITAYDATKLALHVKNNETSKSLIIKYIRMLVGTAVTGMTTQRYEFRTDTQTGLASGGTALTARRPNLAVASSLGNIVGTVGTPTTVAGSANEQLVYSGLVRSGVGAAGDLFTWTFGETLAPANNGFALALTTTAAQIAIGHGPLIVPPGGALRMAHWGASATTGGAFEWEIGAVVR